MEEVVVKDKKFKLLISELSLAERIGELSEVINERYKNTRPVFIIVLNGAFLFASELIKNIRIDCEVQFIKVHSYKGMASGGTISWDLHPANNLSARNVVIVEDIIDTGITVASVIEELKKQEPASIEVASLLVKPQSLKFALNIEYSGFKVPSEFVVGYGLDYDGLGRNLRGIYQLKDSY